MPDKTFSVAGSMQQRFPYGLFFLHKRESLSVSIKALCLQHRGGFAGPLWTPWACDSGGRGGVNMERTIPPTPSWRPAGTHHSHHAPGKCGPASGFWISEAAYFISASAENRALPSAPSSAFHVA